MFKKTLFILFAGAVSLNLACQSVEKTNSNSTVSSNANAALIQSPEFSGNSAPVSAEPTPGIPDPKSMNANLRNGEKIPGINDSPTAGKPLPKGATPTPGIPSEAELKKQFNKQADNSRIERKPPVVESNSSNKPD
jgi:hypothetical protein